MLKKTIKYTDFNGTEQSDDYYFHLSKAELIELELSEKDGLSNRLEAIVKSEDGAAIVSTFKKLLLQAYGQKSPDGKRFIKSEALRNEFVSSEAYSELFTELITDENAASAFINGIIPANLESEFEHLKADEAPKAPVEEEDLGE